MEVCGRRVSQSLGEPQTDSASLAPQPSQTDPIIEQGQRNGIILLFLLLSDSKFYHNVYFVYAYNSRFVSSQKYTVNNAKVKLS